MSQVGSLLSTGVGGRKNIEWKVVRENYLAYC